MRHDSTVRSRLDASDDARTGIGGRNACFVVDDGKRPGENEAGYQGPEEARYQGPEEARYQGPEEARYQGPEEARYQGPEEARYQGPEEARYWAGSINIAATTPVEF